MTRWILALLFLSSCSGMSTPDTATSAEPAPAKGRYLALGDSYTIGESVAESERFPVQLVRELGLSEPAIIAKTGWTTDELGHALDAVRLAGPFDLVTLLIGVNNQYRGRDAEQYRGEFSELLQRAIGFAGGDAKKVVVVSIPDWGVTPFAEGRDRAKIATEIDRYNAINREDESRRRALRRHHAGLTRRRSCPCRRRRTASLGQAVHGVGEVDPARGARGVAALIRQHLHFRDVAVLLREVQPVADHELLLDREADEIGREGDLACLRLVEEGRRLHFRGAAALDVVVHFADGEPLSMMSSTIRTDLPRMSSCGSLRMVTTPRSTSGCRSWRSG